MALVFPNSGEAYAVEVLVNKTAQENMLIKLFVNSQAIAEATAPSSLTEMSAGNGYSAKMITPSSWATTVGDPSYVQAPQQSWTFTASLGPVHGYFIVGSATGKLIAAEQFSDGPYNIVRSGDIINLTPRIEGA